MPFYITPQTPLQVNETKKKLQEMNTKYREENVKTKIIGNKLVFPNGNVYRDRVQPPRAEDILTMEDEEIERLEETVVVKGEELTQEGNTFKGLSSSVQTYAHIKNMYKKVLLDPEFACANHNILAYRFKDAEGRVHDGYCDNGEYGAGRRMLRALADKGILNAAVIVSRRLGKHLGPRRFEIMNKLALSAAAKL
uniref:Protein IMPACT homolog n=1 Tax=Crassostrea virginica TaxID=6565 RepID=A0A8B8BX19_CRAVI|nr:protein IMPACT homolog [Crassostrea virginica]